MARVLPMIFACLSLVGLAVFDAHRPKIVEPVEYVQIYPLPASDVLR